MMCPTFQRAAALVSRPEHNQNHLEGEEGLVSRLETPNTGETSPSFSSVYKNSRKLELAKIF